MLPNGGGTFIVHTIIIIVHWIIRKPIHFLIFLIVFGFFTTQVFLLAKTSVKDNNFSYLENFYKCFNDDNIDINKKYVILRFDDIQASYLSELSLKMINEGLSRKIPFTLGVIPMNLSSDKTLVKYLNKNQCNFEFALHGFTNRQDIPEFMDISEHEANIKINAGLEELNKITNKKVITFIPPNNAYSTSTINVLKSKQFKVVSAGGDSYFDSSSFTYLYSEKKLANINSIINKSNEEIMNKGFSIISIRAQDYIDELGKVDVNKYSQYVKLLDSLKKAGFSFTTIQNYHNYLVKEGINTDFFDNTINISEFNELNKTVVDNRKG